MTMRFSARSVAEHVFYRILHLFRVSYDLLVRDRSNRRWLERAYGKFCTPTFLCVRFLRADFSVVWSRNKHHSKHIYAKDFHWDLHIVQTLYSQHKMNEVATVAVLLPCLTMCRMNVFLKMYFLLQYLQMYLSPIPILGMLSVFDRSPVKCCPLNLKWGFSVEGLIKNRNNYMHSRFS